MTNPMEVANDRSIRLWIDLPYKDETISSFLDRAAGLYQLNRMQLVELIDPEYKLWKGYPPDFDGHMGERLVEKILKALGWHEEQEPINFTSMAYDCLRPSARFAYCPLCFNADLKVGRTPYFRWQWAVPYLTLCHEHSAPLCVWEKSRAQQRVLPLEWCADPKPIRADKYVWFANHLKIAEQGLEELRNSNSGMSFVHRLQTMILALEKGPEDPLKISGAELTTAIERGCAWITDGLPPVACPISNGSNIFAEVVNGKQLIRCAIKRFHRQKSVAWRRSILFYAAQEMING